MTDGEESGGQTEPGWCSIGLHEELAQQCRSGLSAEQLAAGVHRELVGGLWDEIGALQLGFLVGAGLRPSMRLLDLGCGCLRGGVRFVRYLEAGHYFGLDPNAALLAAGYDVELARAGLQDRLPRTNLLVDAAFAGWRWGQTFDFGLAQSVFTHLPPARLHECLAELSRCFATGGRFYLTYFECPPGWAVERPRPHRSGGTTYRDRDPFHYRVEDLAACTRGLPWRFERIGEWGHPRDQHMALFTRR